MIELAYDELMSKIDNKDTCCVLGYTSMCGTCESAKKMLHIISQTVKDVAFYQINVNHYKKLIDAFNMTSIPVFLLFKDGVLMDTFYAFYSVTYLYDKIKMIN